MNQVSAALLVAGVAAVLAAGCASPPIAHLGGPFLWGAVSAGETDPQGGWRETLDLGTSLHLSALRMSVAWSRVEPAPGRFDQRAIAYYARIAAGARARSMTPIITLFHATSPAWLDRPDLRGRRGWERPDAAASFARYAGEMAGALGNSRPLWLTLDEPTVFAYDGYVTGPPGKRDWRGAWLVLGHLLDAHARAYRTIHAHIPHARVSFATLALDVKLWHAHEAYATDKPISRPFWRDWHCNPDLWLLPLLAPNLRAELDFAAIDYDGPHSVVPEQSADPASVPVYPRGLYETISAAVRFFHLPVLVTSRGLTADDDARRPDGWTRQAFLVSCAQQVLAARAQGLPVLGYCYRYLLDDGDHGAAKGSGLFRIDRQDQGQTLTPSTAVAYYEDIAEHDAVRPEIAALIAAQRGR